MKINIAIITGGDSSEEVISLKSAWQVRQNIDPDKYTAWIVYIKGNDWHVKVEASTEYPINKNDFSFLMSDQIVHLEFAFFAMHGPPGEDGKLQAYFDLLGIPYSTSGVLSLALSFNKFACKNYLSGFDILTANAVLIKKIEDIPSEKILEQTGLPCFIKPNSGGSSFGVSRVNTADQFREAIAIALKEDSEVLVEEYIPGIELTCGVLKTSTREYIFPLTEVISKNEFFDYEAKYTEGMAKEITPAEIPEGLAAKCQAIASRIYDLLDCRGIVRIDFINRDGELYFLELNGIPGMSRESIVPKQIRSMGMKESQIYNMIIQDQIS